MCRTRRALVAGITATIAVAVIICAVSSVRSQPPPPKEPPEPAPPPNQTYTGVKQCSSCHFKQYTSWKKTKHAKEAFEKVPKKYLANAECMICHATGFGASTGYKNATSVNLAGTTCEACHGPGSEHEKVCKPLANVKKLSPEQEKAARDSIYKILPYNVCKECHLAQSHKEHPKYDKQ